MRTSTFSSAVLASLCAASAVAQGRYDYHPHVGELHSNVQVTSLETSNGFNVPDGVWNNGEGFLGSGPNRGVDRGGMGELDDGSTLLPGDIHIQQGWAPHTVLYADADMVPVHRLVGFLYPENLYNALSPAEQSALSGYTVKNTFEVFVPTTFDPGLDTVVVVNVLPTIPGPASLDTFGRFQPQALAITGDYSGQDFNTFPPYSDADDGLAWNGNRNEVFRADADRVAALSGSPSGYNFVSAYIVPPDNDQHGVLTIQRTLQLTKALEYVLDSTQGALWPGSDPTLGATWNGQPDNEWPLPVMIVGGSNGALITQYMVVNFPDRYHGAMCMRMSGSLRMSANSHETWEYIAGTQAAGQSTSFHRIQNVHPLGAFLRTLVPEAFVAPGGMYARGDALMLWMQGLAPRPMYFVFGDEDTVFNGESSMWRWFEGAASGADTYHPCGAVDAPIGGKGPGGVYWSASPKNGHEPFSRFLVPSALSDTGSNEPLSETIRAIPYFADEVIASYTANPTHPRPDLTTTAAPPAAGDSEHDAQGWVFTRGSTANRRTALPATPLSNALVEDKSFHAKQRGLGAYLGSYESLVADDHSEKVFVGSIDGVTTALLRSKKKSNGFEILRRVGASSLKKPASLGYAVRGIATTKNHLAIALQRRLMVFDKSDLTTPMASIELDWDEYAPKNLHLTEDLFGKNGVHVVYHSHVGELVVRDAKSPTLVPIAWSSQPSIVSLAISDQPGITDATPFTRKMYLSTESGHVVEFCMSKEVPSRVVVTGASGRIGTVRDLAYDAKNSGPKLAGIVERTRVGQFAFMKFRTKSDGRIVEEDIVTFDSLVSEPADYRPVEQCFPPQIEVYGDGVFAVLAEGIPFLIGDANAKLVPALSGVAVELRRVPAARFATAIDVADIDHDGKRDLVIATESGQVMWIPASVAITGDTSWLETTVLGDDWFAAALPADPIAYSSGSVSSTWGMTWGVDSLREELALPGRPERLQVVDQCGRRWAIDEDGTPHYLHVIKDSEKVTGSEIATIRRKPFRDLQWIGARAPSILEVFETTFDLGALLNPSKNDRDYLYRASFWQAVFLIARDPGLWVDRYNGTVGGLIPWLALRPDNGFNLGQAQPFADGYLPFSLGGDARDVSGGIYSGKYAYYWNGTTASLPGILRGFRLDDSNPSMVLSDPWGSSSSGSNVTTWTLIDPSPFPNESNVQAHLRHVAAAGGVFDAQSLRIGQWDSASPIGPFPLRAIVSTLGGRVIVNNTDPGVAAGQCITTSSEDRGLGGLALCVEDVHGNDLPTIFAGTIFTHEGHFPGGPVQHDLVASLHVYKLDGSSGESLVELDTRVFDGSGGDAKLFGLCGIATGNIVDDADGIQDELILTTLNGDLVIYDLDGVGDSVTIGATPLYWQVFDGSLGVSNSILVRPPEGGKDVTGELYVAGSMGTRKFSFIP